MKNSWPRCGRVCAGGCGEAGDSLSIPRETSLFELGFVILFTFNFLSLLLMDIHGKVLK